MEENAVEEFSKEAWNHWAHQEGTKIFLKLLKENLQEYVDTLVHQHGRLDELIIKGRAQEVEELIHFIEDLRYE